MENTQAIERKRFSIVHCPNSPDGYDYDLWEGNKLVERFETFKKAEKYVKKNYPEATYRTP